MTDKAVRPNIEFWRGSKGIIGEACEYSLRLEALLQQAVDALARVNETAIQENGCQGDCRISCESCAANAALTTAAKAGITPKETR